MGLIFKLIFAKILKIYKLKNKVLDVFSSLKKYRNLSFTEEHFFMGSVLIVNGVNYLYNMLLGRYLGPKEFADAALLVTFLLVLSFFATTFQIVSAKFIAQYDADQQIQVKNILLRSASVLGLALAVVLFVSAPLLQKHLNTQTDLIFKIFAWGIPAYLLLSINRGIYQGKQRFVKLSITYQSEVWVKFLVSFSLLFLATWLQSSVAISIAIVLSIIVALFPWEYKQWKPLQSVSVWNAESKPLWTFFTLTLFYEFTQILINNSDIILVKSYFSDHEAGLYASLALIGRLVYFMAWMFVMLLLPKVIEKNKLGLPTLGVLIQYLGIVGVLSIGLIGACFLFPEFIINIMFGELFLPIKDLLWKYALATALFALSNVIVYYFLSLDTYMPVGLACGFGILQIILISLFHSTLEQVVWVQIYAMGIMFVLLFVFLLLNKNHAFSPPQEEG